MDEYTREVIDRFPHLKAHYKEIKRLLGPFNDPRIGSVFMNKETSELAERSRLALVAELDALVDEIQEAIRNEGRVDIFNYLYQSIEDEGKDKEG